jgi:hypothetical protein
MREAIRLMREAIRLMREAIRLMREAIRRGVRQRQPPWCGEAAMGITLGINSGSRLMEAATAIGSTVAAALAVCAAKVASKVASSSCDAIAAGTKAAAPDLSVRPR